MPTTTSIFRGLTKTENYIKYKDQKEKLRMQFTIRLSSLKKKKPIRTNKVIYKN